MENYIRNGYRALAAATLLTLSACGEKATKTEEPVPASSSKYEFEKHQVGVVETYESHTSSFEVQDMDGDGDKDIVVFGYSGKIYIFENKGKNVQDKTAPSPLEQKIEADQH